MKNKQATLNGFLDQGCTIRGDVVFSELLRVHGHVVGTVTSEHELLVGEGGVVEGEVKVGSLVVAGTVRGTVRVTRKMIVHAGGRVSQEFLEQLGQLLEIGAVKIARPHTGAPAPWEVVTITCSCRAL